MKRAIIILVIIVTARISFAQNFEGKIIYATHCKSKNPQVTDQQYTTLVGTTMEYFIKGGNYKTITNGFMLKWQLFTHKDHKLYTKMASSESILWRDASVNKDQVLKIEVNKAATIILGYTCDELILRCKNGTHTYYFNSKLGVDVALFDQHQYGNWATYLAKAKALPLKSIIEMDQFIVESVATDIQPMKLDDAVFKLPENATFKESSL